MTLPAFCGDLTAEQIIFMRQQGVPLKEIARRAGRSEQAVKKFSCRHKITGTHGGSRVRPCGSLTAMEIQELSVLGLTRYEIARRSGVTDAAVVSYCRRHGFPKPKGTTDAG